MPKSRYKHYDVEAYAKRRQRAARRGGRRVPVVVSMMGLKRLFRMFD